MHGEAWIDTFIINTGEFVGADPTQAPDVPSDVTATQGDFSSKVRVSWEPVHEAPQYRIYRRSDDADWTHVGTTENASFSDFDAEPGVEYRYYVKSTSVGGTSAKSEVVEGWVRGKPAAPADLEASAGEFSTKVRVEWDAVFNATSYRVYRRAPGDSGWTHVDTITGLVWNDFDVDPGDEYRYSVKARNSAGTSPRSNVETGFAGGD